MKRTNYLDKEISFLCDGFRGGFDLQYQGPTDCHDNSTNTPFTVDNELELWNKVMKEVKERRFDGPFSSIPYDYYIQSPISLVPKAGDKTRLIFHLSYDFGELEH